MVRFYLFLAILILSAQPNAAKADEFIRLLSYHCDQSSDVIAFTYKADWNEEGDDLVLKGGADAWKPSNLVSLSKDETRYLQPKRIEKTCVIRKQSYKITVSALPKGTPAGMCGGEIGGYVRVVSPNGSIRNFDLEEGSCFDMDRDIIVSLVFYAGANQPIISKISNKEFSNFNGFRGFHAGFDCEKARSASERLICFDKGLAELDLTMSKTFRERMNDLSLEERKNLLKSQREWLRSRDQKCLPSHEPPKGDEGTETISCLSNSYHDRLGELASRK